MKETSVNTSADLVVYGKIFTSENNQIVEAFAVKDGKYVYVGDKAGAEAFIEPGKTEIVDYTGKGLVMPGCGNGHAHYSIGVALPIVGTVAIGATPDKFMNELVPAAVKKAREANATGIFGFGWSMRRASSASVGVTSPSGIRFLPVNSWMPSAVIFPCTLPMMRGTRAWPTPLCWSMQAL